MLTLIAFIAFAVLVSAVLADDVAGSPYSDKGSKDVWWGIFSVSLPISAILALLVFFL